MREVVLDAKQMLFPLSVCGIMEACESNAIDKSNLQVKHLAGN